MKIYFDMDGVLADLDGMLAANVGASRAALSDHNFRTRLIDESIARNREQHWLAICANQPSDFKSIMRHLAQGGAQVEILTSYGQSTMADCGVQAHFGKHQWLERHYSRELRDGTICRFNGVQNCWQKQFYAEPSALLFDDQRGNVEQWRARGGRAVLYDIEKHSEFLTTIEQVLKELN